jgi:hypothetical protein
MRFSVDFVVFVLGRYRDMFKMGPVRRTVFGCWCATALNLFNKVGPAHLLLLCPLCTKVMSLVIAPFTAEG